MTDLSTPLVVSTEHMAAVFASQAATALRLRSSSAEERVAKIRRLRDAVLAHTEDWYRLAAADLRKPAGEVDMGEILPICVEANDAIANLKKWMKPKRVWPTMMTGGTRSEVQFAPRGRSLIIGPFNYPLNLTLGPLVSAIAAGNTAIVKPSELTPHMSGLICQLIADLFPPDEVATFQGDAQVSQALLDMPFDHIFFTGSPTVGKYVMGAAAKHLASVTLELGGKSPTIVDASADLQLAAASVMFGKFSNAGQTCIAPDYVYVHESVKARWIDCCKAELAKAYGDTAQAQAQSAHYTRIVNPRHTARIAALLEDAKAHGAQVLAGGAVDAAQCYIQPTLLDNIGAGARILDEEIFGPLLPIIGFTDLDAVIAHVNAGPKPLALYIYSKDEARIDKVLTQTQSGGACVNHALIHFLHGNLPFGGVGNSGVGNAHGHYGFKAFSHEKAVVRTQFSMAATLLRAGAVPPWLSKVLRAGFKWI
jgi:aldehyde dehydrogenase (NAD+)